MKISKIILDRIVSNYTLDAYVKTTVSRISAHISSSSMVFFPEYTDHDISHFEAVLDTAVDLATEKSLELLSDLDLGLLTTSVMLHDLGMHLTRDGFQTLIASDGPLKPINGFDDLPWHELWMAFLAESRRFDARKLESLFGSNFKPITAFPSNDEAWDEFDHLLVGEFLRRHHPRLAHEIAVQGMPSIEGTTVELCPVNGPEDRFLSDIGGLIARSHGMPLRETFSYIEKFNNNKIEIRGSHPVFLMTLLRIADYLQIQSARAPTARTTVTKFKSPISTREWSVHQCVADITNITDPEAIEVTARPESIETFLRLTYWVKDIQRELDISWAILGEVYGLQSHSGLNNLGMRIRRVTSNLDNVDKFAEGVDYIPENISFETAGSDLLKLLVGPLYANDVSVGLRELVQNATDAVKEIDQLIVEGLIEKPEVSADLIGDVQVTFVMADDPVDEKDAKVIEVVITDRGVGMNTEVVKNYFLRAGASFRSSTSWKSNFEKPDGSNKIQRSGRFGVGALAAFLLGDKIDVETRHYSEPINRGLKFAAGIDTPSINIIKKECPVGTKIRIEVPERLQEAVGDLLPWRHRNSGFYKVQSEYLISGYLGRYPQLHYTANGEKFRWDKSCFVPSSVKPYEGLWKYFETVDFEVNWGYHKLHKSLTVNQIFVSKDSAVDLDTSFFSTPALCIGDISGSFPLNLQRNSVAAEVFPFETELLVDITDEFIFTCLYQIAQDSEFQLPEYEGLALASHTFNGRSIEWFCCAEGVILNNSYFLHEYDPRVAVVLYGQIVDTAELRALLAELPDNSIAGHILDQDFAQHYFAAKGKLNQILGWNVNRLIERTTENFDAYIPSLLVKSVREGMRPGVDAKRLLSELVDEGIDGWLVKRMMKRTVYGKFPLSYSDLKSTTSNLPVVTIHELSGGSRGTEYDGDAVVFKRWMDLVGTPYLPTSQADANKLLDELKKKFGRKYGVFEKRELKARRKIEKEKSQKLK